MSRIEALLYSSFFTVVSLALLSMHGGRGIIVVLGGVSGAAACWAWWYVVFYDRRG